MNTPELTKSEQAIFSEAFEKGAVRKLGKVLVALDTDMVDTKAPEWDWNVVRILERRFFYITVEEDYDFEAEIGDDGEPVYMVGSYPVSVTVDNKEATKKLSYSINAVINFVDEVIRKTNIGNGIRLMCPRCRHYLFTIVSLDELSEFLFKSFTQNKYICKKCRARSHASVRNGKIYLALVVKDGLQIKRTPTIM
jgi:hypothetical protein